MINPFIHIAGPDITIGPFLRQRCGWCGTTLIDEDIRRVMVPVGQEGGGRTAWPVSSLVAIQGNMSWVVEHKDGERLPDGSCGLLDPAVTA